MALLFRNEDGSYEGECPLCNRQLEEPLFGTTHFIADESDRLYPYSDSVMHWECYANWKYQKRFAAKYFEITRDWKRKNQYWACVAETEKFLLTANPNLAEPMLHLDLRSIGPGFHIPIRKWDSWVSGGWNDDCCHDLQSYAILEIIEELGATAGNGDAIMTRSRWMIENEGRTTRCTEVADRPFPD